MSHVSNGTGSTNQSFSYLDGRGETYFRETVALYDQWVADTVWGTLRNGNPPVPSDQIPSAGG